MKQVQRQIRELIVFIINDNKIGCCKRYYYSIKDMTGNSCIGWARLAMSGFYNSLNERLEGKQYCEKDRDKVIDILERYNKTSLKTISIQNLRYFRKVVK